MNILLNSTFISDILLHTYIKLSSYWCWRCNVLPRLWRNGDWWTIPLKKYGDIGNFSGVTSVILPFMNLKYVGILAPTAKIIGDIPYFYVLNVPKTQPWHNTGDGLANGCQAIISSAAAKENSWVAQWTTQLVRWVVPNNFGLSNIKIFKQKMYILITTQSDLDFGKKNSLVASCTCSLEYLGRQTIL